MSPKLELTELIERYLRNELSPQDRIEFENRMNTDARLQQEVDLQREVMQGIERAALKQKAKKAYQQYKTGKNLWNWGLSGLGIIMTAGAILFYMNSKPDHHSVSEGGLPALNEKGDTAWADADRMLPGQLFSLDAQKDTVIVTEGGIVMAIPANAFIDGSGNPASGTIELEVKEALDPAAIIKAGLSTRSGEELLETGGMFYVNAKKDNNSLKIDPKNAIYAEVPTNEVKPGMMLFEGERKPDGTIDWINPKQLVRELMPVDILSLDFYPPNYRDSLEGLGYDRKNKKFTDSLYYSFASEFNNTPAPVAGVTEQRRFVSRDTIALIADTAPSYALSSSANTSQWEIPENIPGQTDVAPKGINPAKVKAIWNKQFQNTLLSTREFEMRMKHIHLSCNNAVLDLYVNNLDKNLCTIDSMAAKIAGSQAGIFLQFAARGDGKLNKPAPHIEKLREFYEKRSKAVTEAIAQTNREFWKKHNKLNNDALVKKTEQSMKESERMHDNFVKEYQMNLNEAYRQLGLPRKTPVNTATYSAEVISTGWFNVDKYVRESVINRTTLDYTDPNTGKKAVIKYIPLKVKVAQRATYDRVLVYLLPSGLSSFMRMQEENGVFTESRNELMHYDLVALGYRGDDVYVFTKDIVNLNSYTIDLVKTTQEKADKQIREMSSAGMTGNMKEEMAYQAFEIQNARREKMLRDKQKLRERIRPVVFPCEEAPCATGKGAAAMNGEKLFNRIVRFATAQERMLSAVPECMEWPRVFLLKIGLLLS